MMTPELGSLRVRQTRSRARHRHRCMSASATPRLKAGERDVEHVAREGVGVFAGPSRSERRTAATPSSPIVSRRKATARRHVAGKCACVDAALWICGDQLCLHLAREREALVLAADARHRPVHEHQREVLRMLAAELVEAPEDRRGRARAAASVERGSRAVRPPCRAAGSLLRPARRRCRPCTGSSRRSRPGCIRCARRSCGSRRCSIALADEELARGVEDRAPDGLAVPFLTFFDAHV